MFNWFGKKAREVRNTTRLLVIIVIFGAAIARWSCGTTCSLGIGEFTLTCPLGYLQMSLASRTVIPELLISVGAIVLLSVILGRFFCGWICPAGLIQKLFKDNNSSLRASSNRNGGIGRTHLGKFSAVTIEGMRAPGNWRQMSSYVVLGGSLLSSFIFGFPVFCAICPVGLTFGTLFAVKGLFQSGELGLELILFPLILGVELFVFRSWCRSLCPLGALLGILGSRSQVLLPVIQKGKCFKAEDVDCQICKKACPEGIDLIADRPRVVQESCTRCLECYVDCPTNAIKLSASMEPDVSYAVE